MGNTTPRSSRNSNQHRTMQLPKEEDLRQIDRKVDEKENICIVMQKDIDLAILHGNAKDIELLKNEINAHLFDLIQVFNLKNIPRSYLRKASLVKHNLETNLAKLKSLEQIQEKNCENPDLVKDLVVEPNCLLPENRLKAVADELTALKDSFARSCIDYDMYCVLDKGGFYLQADLRNIEIPTTSFLHQRKQELIEELAAFRDAVSSKFAEIQEHQSFTTKLDNLFVELNEAATDYDFEVVHKKTLALRDQVLTLVQSTSKETLLKKLNEIEQSITSLREKCPEERHSELSDENLYSNFEVLRAQLPETLQNNFMTRGTIYANEDAIRSMDLEEKHTINEVEIKKPPLPLPRNTEDTVINNLPRHWQKLNEILSADSYDETNRAEIEHIQKQIETAKKLFEKKMELVLSKFEETVEF